MIDNKFKSPILVTRPLLPNLGKVYTQLEDIWNAK